MKHIQHFFSGEKVANTPPVGFEATSRWYGAIKNALALLFSSNNPTCRVRVDYVSSSSRCRVLTILLLCLTLFVGVGNVWGADYYVKVTSTSDITDGDYLIVYEAGNVAFNGSLTTLDATSNTISVSISDGTIEATNATNSSKFTISTSNNNKLLQSNSGYYIGNTSNSNSLSSSTSTAYTNTISIDNSGNASIVSSGGAYLRYNSTSGQTRFRYFKSSSYSNQKAIQLYKFESSGSSKTTLFRMQKKSQKNAGP